MLFNSYEFIFLFLIPVFVLYRIVVRLGVAYAMWFLVVASVVFYAQWSMEHLLILLGSVVFNYGGALLFARNVGISRNIQKGARSSFGTFFCKAYLYVVVVFNLIPLVYYKYSGDSLVLPLALSFFTFQQIAFGVDLYRGKIEFGGFREYLFFVMFFPQLVAGPIVHYNEIIGQSKRARWLVFDDAMFSRGVLLFSMGLFKKVVLADSFAGVANDAFGGVATLSSYDAWLGLFAYSFEIYFDFSGYADMAIGLGMLFGIVLPLNFDSPYKSGNIVEFWRRWHITLSNFLKEYIYIALGGNRHGVFRVTLNLLITMVIGGIWHGAGWNFLLWGFLHGVLLGVVHFWGMVWESCKNVQNEARFSSVEITRNIQKGARSSSGTFLNIANIFSRLRFGSVLFTFLMVSLLWVLFRAESFGDALAYYDVLFSFEGVVPQKVGGKEYLILMGFVVVWFLPNAWEFSKKMSIWVLFVGAVMFFVSLRVMANAPSMSFVYFNF